MVDEVMCRVHARYGLRTEREAVDLAHTHDLAARGLRGATSGGEQRVHQRLKDPCRWVDAPCRLPASVV